MEKLSPLEFAVLEKYTSRVSEREILRAQINNATVVGRENTGVGFFTKLTTNEERRLRYDVILPEVFVVIDGVEFLFTLFLDDGKIQMLEGSALKIGDSTDEIDIKNCEFKLIDE